MTTDYIHGSHCGCPYCRRLPELMPGGITFKPCPHRYVRMVLVMPDNGRIRQEWRCDDCPAVLPRPQEHTLLRTTKRGVFLHEPDPVEYGR